MSKYIIKRVNDIADYIILTENTIRDTALVFGVSKSTVHKDMHERLYVIDLNKYNKVRKIMDEHTQTRHIRGGESTRQLFLKKKNVSL
ncbi:MAG: sporulation transcriptional regulator SpoIIID [Bacilli bacterium]|nr:sporulation transcriptional regulator SpoIIID [Bacilli bacterium]